MFNKNVLNSVRRESAEGLVGIGGGMVKNGHKVTKGRNKNGRFLRRGRGRGERARGDF